MKQGYNPFADNTALYNQLNQKETERKMLKEENTIIPTKDEEAPSMDIIEAFDFGLKLKEQMVSERTISDYDNKIKNLLKWLTVSHPNIKTITI